jgi:anti-anti-sigma factor
VSTLNASAAAEESGPLITLSGEADVTNAAELSELITGQLSGGTLHLTIDASGLTFADTSALRVLVLAARALRQHGGDLVLLRPPRTLVRVMAITGTDEMFTIHGVTEPRSRPEP